VNKHFSHINTAKEILKLYKGDVPLSSYLKKYFSSNKKFGSKDRKAISHVCYCFCRLGKAVISLPTEERILTGLFLCSNEPNEILATLRPEWNEKIDLPIREKLLIINHSLLILEIFPWKDELSTGIDHEEFSRSFLTQPDLFVRLRPGKEKSVINKLRNAGKDFEIISQTCLALPNSSKLDEIIELDNEAVIQDLNSQRTGDFIQSEIKNQKSKIEIWDCCAASGGKSIMAYDINPNIRLTVSDIRESILVNLGKRFQRAGIKVYKSFIADLAAEKQIPIPMAIGTKFQTIICDAPCTGSGTWSRTPEQLYFFKENEIERFSLLQKKIVSNVIPHLQTGGSFIYITCSVFRKENEEVAEFIKQNFHLQLKQIEILKGYNKKADSMFIAVFEKL